MDPRVERTRRRALEAAQALLVTDGLESVTHLRVAGASGVGRRTLYRHWPDRRALLVDTLSQTRAPTLEPAADLGSGLSEHLRALEHALVHGPLALIVSALHERSVHDPDLDAVRAELVTTGCAALVARLRQAARSGELPAALDVRTAVAVLEGPVFHAAILDRRALGPSARDRVVAGFLAHPPVRNSA